MAIDRELAERCVALLQEMIDLDQAAVTALSQARVPCSKALADHPTIQVNGDPCEVGLLGVLNGLCGVYDDGPRKGWGAVALVVSDDGRVTSARLLENESRTRPKPLAFGKLRNVSPTLVDPIRLHYQLHDGSIREVTSVKDTRVLRCVGDYDDIAAASPGDGEYATSLKSGFIALGTRVGDVTVDFEGEGI